MKSTLLPFCCILVLMVLCSSCRDTETIEGCGPYGELKDGVCTCKLGYKGADCTIKRTPRSITLKQYTMLDYRLTDDSNRGFDDFDGPDIYLKIRLYAPDGTSSDIYQSPVYENISSNTQPLVFDFPTSLEIPIGYETHFLIIDKDEAPDTDDYMYIGNTVIPYVPENGWLNTSSSGHVSGATNYRISYDWNFED